MPEISVIVCTYNRLDRLRDCLESLLAQSALADRFEILVVDNNCTDGTGAYLERLAGEHGHLRAVAEAEQGLSHARNRGAKEARADWVVYLDDDAKAGPEYVENLLRIIGEQRPDILGGPVLPYYTTPKPGWFKDEYEIRSYCTESKFSTGCRVSGSNFALPVALLERLGGFDTGLGMRGETRAFGEDADLLDRYRESTPEQEQRVYYALECPVYHHVPAEKMRLSNMLARQFALGRFVRRRYAAPSGLALLPATLLSPLLMAGYFLDAWEIRDFGRFDPVTPLGKCAKLAGKLHEGFALLIRRTRST